MGLYRDNGNKKGNYYSMLGLYRDNGKENGNYYSGFRVLGIEYGVYAELCEISTAGQLSSDRHGQRKQTSRREQC